MCTYKYGPQATWCLLSLLFPYNFVVRRKYSHENKTWGKSLKIKWTMLDCSLNCGSQTFSLSIKIYREGSLK